MPSRAGPASSQQNPKATPSSRTKLTASSKRNKKTTPSSRPSRQAPGKQHSEANHIKQTQPAARGLQAPGSSLDQIAKAANTNEKKTALQLPGTRIRFRRSNTTKNNNKILPGNLQAPKDARTTADLDKEKSCLVSALLG